MLPTPSELNWPPPRLPAPCGEQCDLWWIAPQVLADLPPRPRARALLSQLLAAYLGGSEPPLQREPRGRPFLALPAAPDFNLSDTRGGSVLAVCGRGRVGIDLERLDRAVPVQRLASRWFAADEAAALAGLDAEPARAEFLRLWTAKEAACKATGSGIFGWLPAWRFAPGEPTPRLLGAPEHAVPLQDWDFQRLTPAPGFTCVLAAWGVRPRWRYFFRLSTADADGTTAVPRGVPRRQASLQ